MAVPKMPVAFPLGPVGELLGAFPFLHFPERPGALPKRFLGNPKTGPGILGAIRGASGPTFVGPKAFRNILVPRSSQRFPKGELWKRHGDFVNRHGAHQNFLGAYWNSLEVPGPKGGIREGPGKKVKS